MCAHWRSDRGRRWTRCRIGAVPNMAWREIPGLEGYRRVRRLSAVEAGDLLVCVTCFRVPREIERTIGVLPVLLWRPRNRHPASKCNQAWEIGARGDGSGVSKDVGGHRDGAF